MAAAPPLKTPRTCSQCGNNGHNARTCVEQQSVASSSNNSHGVMIFGVRLTPTKSVESLSYPSQAVSPTVSRASSDMGFRKCMSMNNLSQYEQQQQNIYDDSHGRGNNDGYASDDALHASGSHNRERKKGVAWTEEEHRLFLTGLYNVGKGDWKGISRKFVKTRSPTQVASHAQKYFLRKTSHNRRRRRSSLFDITTDTITRSSSDNQLHIHDTTTFLPKPAVAQPIMLYPPTRTNPVLPPSSKMANLNLNESPTCSSPTSSTSTNSSTREFEPLLSLRLPQPPPSDEESSRRSNGFGGFNSNGDSIITVA